MMMIGLVTITFNFTLNYNDMTLTQEPIGVKSQCFGEDLAIFRKNYSQG